MRADTLEPSSTINAVPPAASTAASTAAWAEDLWNDHGQLVYSMACALLGDESAAMQAVAEGMVDFVQADAVTGEDTTRALARHVYRRTTYLTAGTADSSALPPAMVWLAQLARLQRAALALCAFGGFTCRSAAELLGTTPGAVAQLLSSGLDEVRRLSEPVIVT